MATTTFNDLITFSRGSNATVTGPNGLIQWAPSNLLTNSQDFEAAAWVKQGSTITANATAAPDGTTTADKVVENSATSSHGIRQTAALTNLTNTLSFYAKKAERDIVNIWAFGGNIDTTATRAGFNLTSGTVVIRPGQTATIQDVGNGWYRCTVSIIITAAGSPTVHIGPNIADLTQDYTGDGTSGVFIWGAQLELGGTATTYNNTSVRNLLGFSEAFDNAGWTKSDASIITGAAANPVNGLFNAQKLMENTANAWHFVRQSGPTTANAPAAISIYAKAAERSVLQVVLSSTPYLSTDWVNFNLANGTVSLSGAGSIAAINSVGNGWYRCTIIATPTVGGGGNISWSVQNSPTAARAATYTGDGNSGVYIYGAQLSNSASLDPYVPTPGAAPSSTAYYGPRFDYDPVTLLPRGLLIEEARTNLALTSSFGTLAGSAGSQYPSGTGWSNLFNTGGTRTYVPSAVFSGAQAMDIASVSTARSVIAFSFAAASSTTYAVSFYVESVSGVTGTVSYATGVLGTGGTTNAIIAPTTPGRYTYTFTTGTGAGTVDVRFGIGAAGNESGSLRISNVQVEAGAFATSYIPTIASTVTRSADVATITGSLFSQWWNNPTGTLIVDYQQQAAVSGDVAMTSDGTPLTNSLGIYGSSTNDVGWCRTGGVNQALISIAATITNPHKAAFAYATNDFALSSIGGAVSTDTSGTIPTINQIRFGVQISGGQAMWLRSFRYVPVRAADFQLQQVTT